MTNSTLDSHSPDIVNPKQKYTYGLMEKDIQSLQDRYPFLEVETIGRSVLGRNLYCLRLGKGPREVFCNGAHHGLEWITSCLLMKFTENALKAYNAHICLGTYSLQELWSQASMHILPMVNPDGVNLVLQGLDKENPYYDQLLHWNEGRMNFQEVWQANIHGVDLNHNYDASWILSKQSEKEHGIWGPGPTRYSGPSPESEPESRALADFTRAHSFSLVLAYHSQGEVIYWDYQQMASPAARDLGEEFARVSSYPLEEIDGIASYGGYKDWFIEKFQKPGYTIEVGKGKNPLPITQFDKIYSDNEPLLLRAWAP